MSDVNECSTKPCQNDAICGDGINTYNCICVGPWQGTNCNLGPFINLTILISYFGDMVKFRWFLHQYHFVIFFNNWT